MICSDRRVSTLVAYPVVAQNRVAAELGPVLADSRTVEGLRGRGCPAEVLPPQVVREIIDSLVPRDPLLEHKCLAKPSPVQVHVCPRQVCLRRVRLEKAVSERDGVCVGCKRASGSSSGPLNRCEASVLAQSRLARFWSGVVLVYGGAARAARDGNGQSGISRGARPEIHARIRFR